MSKAIERRLERLERAMQEGQASMEAGGKAISYWALLFASARGDTEPNSDDWGVAASFIHRCRRLDVAPTWVELVRWTQTTTEDITGLAADEEGEGGHGAM